MAFRALNVMARAKLRGPTNLCYATPQAPHHSRRLRGISRQGAGALQPTGGAYAKTSSSCGVLVASEVRASGVESSLRTRC